METKKYFLRSVLLVALMIFQLPLRAQDDPPSCNLTVQMYDQYGDGWNDAYVEFFYHGMSLGTAAVPSDSSESSFSFSAPADSIFMMWHKGYYDEECKLTITSIDGEVLYAFDFGYWPSSYGSYGDSVSLGSFVNICPSCLRPSGLHLSSATQTSLTVAWDAGDATAWNIVLGPRGFTPDWSNGMSVTFTSYTFSELLPNTAYDIYLRTNCDNIEYSTVASIACMTQCPPVTCDYTLVLTDNNNNGNGFGFLKNSIEVVNAFGMPLDTLYINLESFSGNRSEKLVSYCPGTYYLRYLPTGYQYSGYNSGLGILVMDAGGDTLVNANLGNRDLSNYIDSFYFSCASCPKPAGLHQVSTSYTSMVVAWNYTDSVQWQVLYGPQGFTPDWDSATLVSNNTLTLENLQSGTAYDIYVRTFCSTDVVSYSRVAKLTCMTQCEVAECEYTLVLTDNNNAGFLKNSIEVVNAFGLPVDTLYINLENYSGNRAEKRVSYCPGTYYFRWLPTGYEYSYYYSGFGIQVYNAEGDIVLNYSMNSNTDVNQPLAGFTFGCPTCYRPSSITCTATDSTAVTLSWNSTGTGVTYLIEYGPENYVDGTRVATTDTFLVLNNLTPDMRYEAYIGTLCGTDDTSSFRQFFFTPGPRLLNRIYVNNDTTTTRNGSSWATAYHSIAEAQFSAYEQGRLYNNHPDIWVAEGHYYENLTVLPSVHLYGGFVGNEAANYDLTQRDWKGHLSVIDGAWNGPCLLQEMPFTAATQTSYDGFLIGGGYVENGTGGVALKAYTVLRNCIIENSQTPGNSNTQQSHSLLSVIGDSNNVITAVENCIFQSGWGFGSAVYLEHANMDNCLLYYNTSAMSIVQLGNGASMRHCDVVNNTLYDFGYAYAVNLSGTGATVVNSIIGGNNNNDNNGHLTRALTNLVNTFEGVTYSAFNGAVSGTGNISVDTNNVGTDVTLNYPVFVSPELSDFRINEGSSFIDAGTAIAGYGATDINGDSRVYGTAPDMGCYEYQGVRICSAPYYMWVESSNIVGGITVCWSGIPADSYELNYCVAGSDSWTSITGIDSNRYTVTGLAQYTSYMFRVRAVCGDTPTAWTSDTLSYTTECFSPIDAVQLEGNGSSGTSYQLPVYTYYSYSGSYFIVTADELARMPRSIDTMGFYHYYGGTYNRYWRIKVYPTNETRITSENLPTILQSANAQVVYDSNITFQDYQWVYIPLQQSFAYDGNSNLVIAILDSTESASSTTRFRVHSTDLHSYNFYGYSSDSYNGPYETSYRPYVYFNGDCDMSSCPRPRLSVEAVTDTTVTVAMNHLSGAPVLEFSADNGATWTAVTGLTINSTHYTFGGLEGNTRYQIRLHCLCNDNDSSLAISVTATTAPSRIKHVYVRADAAAGGNGASWATALSDINEAVSTAVAVRQYYNYYPDVRVAAGVYYGDTSANADAAFLVRDAVSIRGGFAGNEPDDYDLSQRDFTTNATILDGRNMHRVMKLHPFYNSWVDSIPVYDGLTLRNGNAYQGAGMYINNSAIVENCRIENCGYQSIYDCYGGGIYIYNSGNTIRNVVVTRCFGRYGAGIYSYGGNIIENCEVSYCHEYTGSESGSGALSVQYGDTVRNCRIFNDTITYYAGIYSQSAYFENCLVWNNYAKYNGIVYLYNSTFVSCDIVQNTTEYSSGEPAGLRISDYNTTVFNSIIWGNRDKSSATAIQINQNGNNYYNVRYSAVEGGYDGVGNIALDHENIGTEPGINYPFFAIPSEGDYRLMTGSACINAGNDSLVRMTTDLAGNARVFGDTIDMGCLENDGSAVCVPPFNLEAMVGANSALITWATLDDVTSTTLEYRQADSDTWTTVENLTGHSYMIENLPGMTTYQYRMRSYCDNESHSAWSTVKNFTTECMEGKSTVVMGDTTTSTTTGVIPLRAGGYGSYYSFSQELFLQSEVGAAGFIDTIRFQMTSGQDVNRRMRIYMGTTTLNRLYGDQVILLEDQTVVYDGIINLQGENGWITIPLQQSFDYNGTGNLVLTMLDTTGTYIDNYTSFYVTSTDPNPRTLYYYSYDRFSVNRDNYFNTYTFRNNVIFSK
ncbi:MAG: fibronectin type III domain-containing protein, partial [Bacteroidales bacterium]|nr:fibronectin type III domain-containing protein [Bacteroidales bacterium]